RPGDLKDPDPNFWRILHQKTRNTWQRVAEEIVIKGDKSLEGVPVGVFGELTTIDRAEIESYSAIRELIIEFLVNPKPKQPLCFAVFGPPGSGKSFGVKQILKDIDEDEDKLKRIIFNISQFGNYQDLVAAFHDVRDIVLEGKVPFVFFDEFDSALDDQRLGWLKYFLAPMQDGEFRDGESTHPIGNAIFVFAGGTKSTYKNFVRNLPENDSSAVSFKEGNDESQTPGEDVKEEDAKKAFRDAKGPDFISRLRGHINVMGPNRQRRENDYDDVFTIRRAKILRTLLKNEPRASGLLNYKGELNIDEGVLRAMLYVTKYEHGTRSMKALIEMSRLEGKKLYDLSALPVREQLDLHVDADEFLFLTKMERYQSMLRLQDLPNPEETSYLQKEEDMVMPVAKLIHEDYAKHREAEGTSSDSMVSFENLPEDFKQSNIDAAEDIPNKLRAINHGIRKIPPGRTARTPDITDEEVEKLASMEHDRFCRERRLLGWVYGEKKDIGNKITPYLVSFNELPDDIKVYNRESIYAIPVILKELGYEIYRMEEVEELDDPYIVDHLARIVHERYFEERGKEGDTPETNPSMVEFDVLPDDLKEANLDYARRIPVLLRSIGYGVKRLQKDAESTLLTLDEEQFEMMAEMEHARWNWQKILQGWVYKEGEKNIEEKTTPYLVPWKVLSQEIQDYDRKSVRVIPELLGEAGYKAYEHKS
ncbi:MAG: RyR domain-containing protein/RyR domain-containing protein, partial [Candidatus Methanomarinus sp.]